MTSQLRKEKRILVPDIEIQHSLMAKKDGPILRQARSLVINDSTISLVVAIPILTSL